MYSTVVAVAAVALVVAGIVTISVAARRGKFNRDVIVHHVGTDLQPDVMRVREPIVALAQHSHEIGIMSLMAPPGFKVHTVEFDDRLFEYHSKKLMHPSRVKTASGPGFDIHYVKLLPYSPNSGSARYEFLMLDRD